VAVKNKPLRARDPRAFLTATRHVGVYSVRAGAKGWLCGTETKGWDQAAESALRGPWSPIHFSEEAFFSRAVLARRQRAAR